jgi:hypothetical protein
VFWGFHVWVMRSSLWLFCRLPKGSGSNSKLGNKGNRELNRLECSINYDSKSESASREKGKERGISVFNEA